MKEDEQKLLKLQLADLEQEGDRHAETLKVQQDREMFWKGKADELRLEVKQLKDQVTNCRDKIATKLTPENAKLRRAMVEEKMKWEAQLMQVEQLERDLRGLPEVQGADLKTMRQQCETVVETRAAELQKLDARARLAQAEVTAEKEKLARLTTCREQLKDLDLSSVFKLKEGMSTLASSLERVKAAQ